MSPVDAVRAAPFARDLAAFGDRVAVVAGDESITYAELAQRVNSFAASLGTARRLVMVCGANTLESLVAYLGALAGGHAVLLTGSAEPADALIGGYDPDVVVREGVPQERRAGSAHLLHHNLALLLSTSGSTGSAKLVRLSHDNLQANAESIATFLQISPDDRAATTLPMHYCYGLSVINSYLLRGASLLLTELSVAEPEFWQHFRAHRCTSFAGVPYTFELLDRCGFDRMSLPHLRYVTQAGGRLAHDRVRRYAAMGARHGWGFFVMYGQTEATARMAYLPPEHALQYPQCIGVAIPGGSLRLEPVPEAPEPDSGELVYSGPNVMLGYAQSAADLAVGRTITELRTGDLARRTPTGLFEIVGRRNRFAKIYGLRIDLQLVEERLRDSGVTALCLADDDRLSIVIKATRDRARQARQLAASASGLPPHAVKVHAVAALPRLDNGKLDYEAARCLMHQAQEDEPDRPTATTVTAQLIALYAEILQRPDVNARSTFVGLGGDSLSYVETSIRLEQALGYLPTDWHLTAIGDFRPPGPPAKPRRRASLDTGIAIRAASIVLIVGTHASLFGISGGAHVLLTLAGFNFARFHLTGADRLTRISGALRSIGRIALASMVWIAIATCFLSDAYRLAQVLLINYFVGPKSVFNDFWFVETIVYILLATLALMAVPLIDRAERRYSFTLPILITAAALITRYQLIPGVKLPTPLAVIWLFTMGWAAAKATSTVHRLLVTVLAVVTIPGFHADLPREILMVAGVLLLTWVPTVPSWPWLNRIAGTLAAASLYIYLTHWQVFPQLNEHSAVLAMAASLAAGIAYCAVAGRVGGTLKTALRNTFRLRKQAAANGG